MITLDVWREDNHPSPTPTPTPTPTTPSGVVMDRSGRHGNIILPFSQGDDDDDGGLFLLRSLAEFIQAGWVSGPERGSLLGGNYDSIQVEVSLVVGEDRGEVGWNPMELESALASFLHDELDPIVSLSLASQTIYDSSLGSAVEIHSLPSVAEQNQRGSVIRVDDLTQFVNASSWGLVESPREEVNKTLRLVLYVPDDDMAPLSLVYQSDPHAPVPGNGFVIPTWGGVVVLNPPPSPFTRLEITPTVIATVLGHLRVLLGVESDIAVDTRQSPDPQGVAEWETDALLSARLLQLVAQTRASVARLVDLVESLPNMVVEDHIASDMWRALALADQAMVLAANPNNRGGLETAVALARKAHVLADRAFFDPSILGLLYFPDEHLYAIYTPLFVPIVLPVVAGLIRELKTLLRPPTTPTPTPNTE